MNQQIHPITPSQQAVNGALDMFVAGQRAADLKLALTGLAVLRSSTESQISTAMTFVATSRHLPRTAIETMLAT